MNVDEKKVNITQVAKWLAISVNKKLKTFKE